MATNKNVTKLSQETQVSPLDELKAKLRGYGALVGGADGAQVNAMIDFGMTISQRNVFAYDPTSTADILEPTIKAHAAGMVAEFVAGRKSVTKDQVTEASVKTYGYRFASAGMVGARSTDLLPELDALAIAFVNSEANTDSKKRIDVVYALCNWIRDKQSGQAATKKKPAIAGRVVTAEEIKKDGFVAMVLNAGKKSKPDATPGNGEDKTPETATATPTPTPAVAQSVPASKEAYIKVMQEMAAKLKDEKDLDPLILKAIQILALV